MGVTLVSIGRITATGSVVQFTGGVCRILNLFGSLVAEIPKTNGLYRISVPAPEVAAPVEEAPAADEPRTMTLDELHRTYSHIAPETARTMVEKGVVEGVELDPSTEVESCESCEAGRMTRKSISKERIRHCAAEIEDEIHSDVWGPAPTQTLGGHRYASSFTDDYS
ncbi:hypothetical protein C8Q76DRAFT_594665, partial [Earliella scabrosa]